MNIISFYLWDQYILFSVSPGFYDYWTDYIFKSCLLNTSEGLIADPTGSYLLVLHAISQLKGRKVASLQNICSSLEFKPLGIKQSYSYSFLFFFFCYNEADRTSMEFHDRHPQLTWSDADQQGASLSINPFPNLETKLIGGSHFFIPLLWRLKNIGKTTTG